ncbi:hypothetical protein D3C76_218370 [compost metagenome]
MLIEVVPLDHIDGVTVGRRRADLHVLGGCTLRISAHCLVGCLRCGLYSQEAARKTTTDDRTQLQSTGIAQIEIAQAFPGPFHLLAVGRNDQLQSGIDIALEVAQVIRAVGKIRLDLAGVVAGRGAEDLQTAGRCLVDQTDSGNGLDARGLLHSGGFEHAQVHAPVGEGGIHLRLVTQRIRHADHVVGQIHIGRIVVTGNAHLVVVHDHGFADTLGDVAHEGVLPHPLSPQH